MYFLNNRFENFLMQLNLKNKTLHKIIRIYFNHMKHAINKNLSIRKNIYIYTYIFGIINLSLFFILNNKKKIKRKAIKYVKYLDKKFI